MEPSGHPEPALHDLVTVVRAPAVVLGARSGAVQGGGVQGFFRNDRRVLSRLEVDVNGVTPQAVGHRIDRPDRAVFVAVVPGQSLSTPPEGPTVRVERTRVLGDQDLTETLTLVNDSDRTLTARLRLTAATDLATVTTVRGGAPTTPARPHVDAEGTLTWSRAAHQALLRVDRLPAATTLQDGAAVLSWDLTVPRGQRWHLVVVVSIPSEHGRRLPRRPRPAHRPRLELPDLAGLDRLIRPQHRSVLLGVTRLAERSRADLDALLLEDPEQPHSVFLAAGSPWYLTLFGRDSLWAARLLLPLGTELAEGTLRALATRQGRGHNLATYEQPGRIPHEVRWGHDPQDPVRLPPLSYGTVDATALWVCLLYEAWRAGLPADRVGAFLPNLQAALTWIGGPGDPASDGFLAYTGSAGSTGAAAGQGLANLGWKDSRFGVCWEDGRLPEPPLALCEVQGYAYQAAVCGAELLDAFGLPGGDRWRAWAADLRARFRARFWIEDADGPYPAIALDGHGEPVSGAASNMGHLLGTGILDAEEAAAVAARLAQHDLDCGYGLRTLSSRSRAFNPLSYHRGSVWPHDTAITLLGLAAQGHHEHARALATQLVEAAEHFGHRLPELWGGTDARAGEPLLAYPSACAPQAWSAAAGIAAAGYLSGWPHPMLTPARTSGER